MTNLLKRVWKDESGQDTAEYALLLLLIALALVAAINSYKSAIASVFSRAGSFLEPTPTP
jgi:Flp pilus assembly pilin Flp